MDICSISSSLISSILHLKEIGYIPPLQKVKPKMHPMLRLACKRLVRVACIQNFGLLPAKSLNGQSSLFVTDLSGKSND